MRMNEITVADCSARPTVTFLAS